MLFFKDFVPYFIASCIVYAEMYFFHPAEIDVRTFLGCLLLVYAGGGFLKVAAFEGLAVMRGFDMEIVGPAID